MATSFVAFHNFGFWCNDSVLETWLSYFLKVLDQQENLPDWLQQLHQNWEVQATVGFVGCIDLLLDEVATDESRVTILVGLVARTNQLLAAHGEFIPAEVLNHLPYQPAGVTWYDAVATALFLKVGQLLSRLLEEKLQTTASSPLDYLEPKNWREPLL
jgi:hypothetical protein